MDAGLAVDDGVIYVGESANRAEPAPGELASVAVIDRQSWSVVDRLPLPSEEVFDVIEVPSVTRAQCPNRIPHESAAGRGAGSALALPGGRRPSTAPLGRR
jgi:hypothetical protein